jgi:hypothetical protein
MSQISVNIQCHVAVVAYIQSVYGKQPVSFPKKDRFNTMLAFSVIKSPPDYAGEPDYGKETLKVNLPYMEDKNVLTWNYVPEVAKKEIAKAMKALMYSEFHLHMDKAKSKDIDFNVHSAVYLFMEKYNIPPVAFDMFLQVRKRYLSRLRVARNKSKKLSDKHTLCPCDE